MAEYSLTNRLEAMIRRLEKENVNMHGFILSVDGVEKAKAYYAPFREGQAHRMYSVSKTMTGIAVGMLADDGKISLDDPITRYFEDWLPDDPHPWLTSLTIRDMLRMATCYRWTTYREGVDENWAKTFFTGKPDHAPGAVFYYDTGCSQALAALVKRISGQEVIDLLEERLFQPLGCEDERFWLRDPSGCCQGGTGLCMSLRDLQKVSLCILNGGEGVIPGWYAREMGEKHIDTLNQGAEEEQYGYCWQCWRTRAGFAMYGLGAQLSMICPEKNVVFSTIADTRLDAFGVQRVYDAFFEEVYPWIGQEDMEPVSFALNARVLPSLPDAAIPETGTYAFEEGNQLRLKTLRLNGDRLIYENARGQVELPFLPGGHVEAAYPGWPDVPALIAAGWVEKGLLRVRCHAIGKAPCGFDMLIHFQHDTVTVQSRKSHDPVTEGYDGVATGRLP